MKILSSPTLAQLSEFDEIIDVRSPSEFAIDHVPGARNYPVLDDEERAKVGTLYTQHSPFLAKKVGAAIVARNIAVHIEASFMDKPKSWKPLVYCWRGGKRSGSMAHILSEIGWQTARLEGGYKAYRTMVLEALEILPKQFEFKVICGPTGCGKSRLLEALAKVGAQMLDLEAIAHHKGSVLGNMPGIPQPSQKYFESCLWSALSKFDPTLPVYVESESKKIGELRVPQSLIDAMWESECIRIEADFETRSSILSEDYAHFFSQPEILVEKLECLAPLHGNETIAAWIGLVEKCEWHALVSSLLAQHYDPAYKKSIEKHYPGYGEMPVYRVSSPAESSFMDLANRIWTHPMV